MTFLSAYLRAEQPDKTEPAGFYIPGATEWGWIGAEMTRRRWLQRERIECDHPPADELPDPTEGENEK
jgi:hypothetical protein